MAYSIGATGMEYLSVRGECFTQKNQRQTRDCTAVPGALLHSLGVNDLYLRMHLDGVLARWKWETQIRAQNELTTVRYAKDYDAIVTVRLEHDEAEFALEYERMAKTHARYKGIRQKIESEPYLEQFVYAVANYDLLNYLGQHFAHMRQRVYLCLFDDLARNSLHAEAFIPGASPAGTLGDVLCSPVH
jgi:hypothetical protein